MTQLSGPAYQGKIKGERSVKRNTRYSALISSQLEQFRWPIMVVLKYSSKSEMAENEAPTFHYRTRYCSSSGPFANRRKPSSK